jgi:hypothetical protein
VTSRAGRGGGGGTPTRSGQQAWHESDAPVSPLGREFLAYWHTKCLPGGGYPTRAGIVPEEMVRLLPYVFMVDVVPDRAGGLDFRFRLVGTAIVEIEGEHTGKLLSSMFPDREAYAVLWRQYVDAAAGKIGMRRETLSWQGRDHVRYEVILAPLQDVSGRASMLIGLAHAPLA